MRKTSVDEIVDYYRNGDVEVTRVCSGQETISGFKSFHSFLFDHFGFKNYGEMYKSVGVEITGPVNPGLPIELTQLIDGLGPLASRPFVDDDEQLKELFSDFHYLYDGGEFEKSLLAHIRKNFYPSNGIFNPLILSGSKSPMFLDHIHEAMYDLYRPWTYEGDDPEEKARAEASQKFVAEHNDSISKWPRTKEALANLLDNALRA